MAVISHAPRAVLFDAAGTLIRPREEVGVTYARFFAAEGARLPAERVGDAFSRVLRGMPAMAFPGADTADLERHERGWWREVVRRTLRAADGTARLRDFDACFAAIFAYYATPLAWEVMPGAEEALATLASRGVRIGVVSNFDQRLRALLADLGLGRWIECIVLPSDVGAVKPAPEIFAAALRALGVAAQHAVHVGDDPTEDHSGAAAAGIRAVDVRTLATLAGLPELIDREGRRP